MYRFYLTLLGFLFAFSSINGQNVNFTFQPSSTDLAVGDNFTIDVLSNDWVDVNSFQFYFDFDDSIIEYVGYADVCSCGDIQSTDIAIFGPDDANGTASKVKFVFIPSGIISLTPYSVDDGDKLFSLEFKVISEGSFDFGTYCGDDVACELVANSQALTPTTGTPITITTTAGGGGSSGQLNIDIQDGSGAENEEVCVDLVATDFTDILSMEYFINFDETVLSFSKVVTADLDPGIVENSTFSSIDADNGILKIAWFRFDGEASTLTAPDNIICSICFDLIGNEGDNSDISIQTSDALVFDLENGSTNVGLTQDKGTISIAGNSGVPSPMFVSLGTANTFLDAEVCVPVLVEDMVDIYSFGFNINYDDQNISASKAINYTDAFTGMDVDISEAGKVKVRKSNTGIESLNDNEKLFDICFKAIGTEGSYPLTFEAYSGTDFPIVREFENAPTSTTINGTNGAIGVAASDELYITFGNNEACYPDDSLVFVPVTVYNFTKVVGFTGVIKYDPTVLQFDAYKNSSQTIPGTNVRYREFYIPFYDVDGNDILRGATPINVDVPGEIRFAFNTTNLDPNGEFGNTIPSGEVFFSLGFTLLNNDGCDITVDDLPTASIKFEKFIADQNNSIVRSPADYVAGSVGCNVTELVINESSTVLTHVSCKGESDGAIEILVEGGAEPYTYLWANGLGTSSSISNLTSGEYCVTVTDANSVTAESCFNILEADTELTVNGNITHLSEAGANDGAIDLTVLGGAGDNTFIWSNTETTEDINGLADGIYSVTITDKYGCEITGTYRVGVEGSLSIDLEASFIQPNNCFGGMNAGINPVIVGGTEPFQASWSGPGGPYSTLNIAGLKTGFYNLTVTDVNGTTAEATFEVTGPNSAVSVDDVTIIAESSAGNDGSIELMVTGGSPNYNFEWSAGGSISNKNENLIAGDYTVTITDANGCVLIESYTVGGSAPLNIYSSATESRGSSCNGVNDGIINIAPIGGCGGYTYAWTPLLPAVAVQTGLSTGTYTVTVTDACGATAEGTFVLTEPEAIEFSVDITHVLTADDGQITLSVSGGTPDYSYFWTGPGFGVKTTATITGLKEGTHNVVVTDAKGCQKSESFVIYKTFKPVSEKITHVNCFGESTGAIDIDLPSGDYSYLWRNSNNIMISINQDVDGLEAGVYSVKITNSDGIEVVLEYTIEGPTQGLSISIVNIQHQDGANKGVIDIDVIGGTPGYSYKWSNNATSQDLTNLDAGIYSVTVTDVKGCTAEKLNIEIESSFFVDNITQLATTCSDECDGSISFRMNGGAAPYNVVWNTGANETITASNPNVIHLNDLCAGEYRVTIVESLGGLIEQTFNISAPSAIKIQADINQNVGNINLTVTGGTGGYDFLWSDNNSTDEDRIGLSSGTYTVTVTDENGCEKTATYTLTSGGAFEVQGTITGTNCPDDKEGSIFLDIIGGVAPFSYQWDDNAKSTSKNLINVIAGTYRVIVTDATGTSVQKEFIIETASTLDVDIIIWKNVTDPINCDGKLIADINGGVSPISVLWSTTETTETIENVCGGKISVTVTDATGCTATKTIIFEEPGVLTIEAILETDPISCVNECDGALKAIINGGVEPYTYAWSNGGFGDVAFNLCDGVYSVTVTDAAGTKISKQGSIHMPLELEVEFDVVPATNQITNDGSAIARVTGGVAPYTYAWNDPNSCDTYQCLGLTQGEYSLMVTDANGCEKIFTVSISGNDEPCLTSRPVITPFLIDNHNDNFVIKCIEDYAYSRLQIFNRWGQLVFETEDYDNSWIGLSKGGEQLPEGGYFYVLLVTDNNGVQEQRKGHITILKE